MQNKWIFVLIISFSLVILVSAAPTLYGHGAPTETLPSRPLGDREVTLEVYSSAPDVNQGYRGEISFLLRDTDTDDPIDKTIYLIKISKDGNVLVKDFFKADKGKLDFEYEPNSGLLYEKESVMRSSSVISSEKNVFGGLYDLHIEILTTENYSKVLSDPLIYDFGLSFPSTKFFEVNDPDFGKQKIGIIAYYNSINNFNYNPEDKSISFSMPFDWPIHTEDELFFIHNEFVFPKTFGDFMIQEFSSSMNGIDTSESIFSIDYWLDENIRVHTVTNYNHMQELLKILKQNDLEKPDQLEFVLKPAKADDPRRVASTQGGIYEVELRWDPPTIISGNDIQFSFNLNSIRKYEYSIPYDFVFLHNEKEIFKENRITPETGLNEEIDMLIPDDTSGQVIVKFANIGNVPFSTIEFPLVVKTYDSESTNKEVSQGILISNWVRNNAGWWADGKITDNDFALGIEFLIKQGIIDVPVVSNINKAENIVIPDWVRVNAGWWAENQISDEDFIKGLEYLVKEGIISV